ncbi:MAG TPA: hypothetical protein VNR66_01500 [Solirubrobacteraceae bacterium]|nr:hypothetical protein [Solirubrobacteraceae bacterium]
MKFIGMRTAMAVVASSLVAFGAAGASARGPLDAQRTEVKCPEHQSCTGSVSNGTSSATVTASPGKSGPAATLVLALDTGPVLVCADYTPHSSDWAAFSLSTSTRSKTFGYTVMHVVLPPGQTVRDVLQRTQLCYGAPYEFTTRSGAPATKTVHPDGTVEYVGLLPECTSPGVTGPCTTGKQLDVATGMLSINAFVPAGLPGDPRGRA